MTPPRTFLDLFSSPLVRSYLRVFSVDVLVKASGIILLPIYLKLMTQEEYGLFGYLVAIISTASLVLNIGMYAAQSKLYHDFPERRGAVLFTLNLILFVFVMLVFAGLILSGFDRVLASELLPVDTDYFKYRPSVLLGIFVAVYALMLLNFFLTTEDIKKVQIFNLTRTLAIHAVVLAILFWSGSRADHAWLRLTYSNVVEFVIILLFSYFYIRRMIPVFDREVAKKALGIGLPIMASAVIGIFVNLGDRYFIERYGSLRDMSVYNVAMTFAGIIPFAFASFQNIWLPQVLKEKDPEVNRSRSRRMVIRLAIGFVTLSAAIMILLKILLDTGIIDDKYSEIMPLLPIVLTTAIVTSLAGMYSNQLFHLNKLYIILLVGVPAALLGVGVSFWLVPIYGIYGAAFTSLLINGLILISYGAVVRFTSLPTLTGKPE